jgi:hypothetical protein
MNPYQHLAQQANHNFMARADLVREYAWAIPNDEAIAAIVGLGKPVIEIGAGNGYWASLIAQAGGTVECYDREPGGHCKGIKSALWYPVSEGGPEVIRDRHRDHALLLVWPPYGTPMGTECLLQYMKAGGSTLVYVGEGYYGCIADDEFYRILDEHWSEEQYVCLPQWYGIHDGLSVYRAK